MRETDSRPAARKLGEQVQFVREELGLTVAEVAEIVRIDVSDLARVEGGDADAIREHGSTIVAVLSRLEAASWIPGSQSASGRLDTSPNAHRPVEGTGRRTRKTNASSRDTHLADAQPLDGAGVRARRKEVGWSQAALGDAIGLAQPTVSQLERGRLGNPEAHLRAAMAAMAEDARASVPPDQESGQRPEGGKSGITDRTRRSHRASNQPQITAKEDADLIAGVRQIRTKLGWSRARLAKGMGMTIPMVDSLERGQLRDAAALARQAIAHMEHHASVRPMDRRATDSEIATSVRQSTNGAAVSRARPSVSASESSDATLIGQLQEYMSSRMLSISRIARECSLAYDVVEGFMAGRSIGVEARERLARYLAGDAMPPAKPHGAASLSRHRPPNARADAEPQPLIPHGSPASDKDLQAILLEGLKDLV